MANFLPTPPPPPPAPRRIPIVLLKTRSQPDDGYEEYFSTTTTTTTTTAPAPSPSSSPSPTYAFEPRFVPVLTHRRNVENLAKLREALRGRRLREEFGGVIFTSQRAVEGWNEVVADVDGEVDGDVSSRPRDSGSLSLSPSSSRHQDARTISAPPSKAALFSGDRPPFPLYTVGPATARALHHRLPTSPTLRSLRPEILGAHTGNGAALASFISNHYNLLHSHRRFTYYEAPRLPFVPLEGPDLRGGARMEAGDERLRKKKLLFLVGETRRDVVPRTLMGEGLGEGRVQVEEWEVYGTRVRGEFEGEFGALVAGFERGAVGWSVVVVVVFSPQGCEAMLRCLGYLGEDGRANGRAKRRWDSDGEEGVRYVVATIGPTTRDHLREKFGFEADVCADKPSPEGLGRGVGDFLEGRGLVGG